MYYTKKNKKETPSSFQQIPGTRPNADVNSGEMNPPNYDRSMDQQDPRDTRKSGGRNKHAREIAISIEQDTGDQSDYFNPVSYLSPRGIPNQYGRGTFTGKKRSISQMQLGHHGRKYSVAINKADIEGEQLLAGLKSRLAQLSSSNTKKPKVDIMSHFFRYEKQAESNKAIIQVLRKEITDLKEEIEDEK